MANEFLTEWTQFYKLILGTRDDFVPLHNPASPPNEKAADSQCLSTPLSGAKYLWHIQRTVDVIFFSIFLFVIYSVSQWNLTNLSSYIRI